MNAPADHEPHVADLYAEAHHWHVNTGGTTIHAKRMSGRFRTLKWWASSVWLLLFVGPYLRWGERQAVLFDIPNRQYHIFGTTFVPQDFWLLTLVLLFFAFLLAFVTAVASRVWCGYFCFQTVWTDVYTWIEERLEGPPTARRALAQAPWSGTKLARKSAKHALWLLIAVLTGISFTAWFLDAGTLWANLFALDLHPVAWVTLAVFTAFTYVFAGFMREQVCFWLCPYARLQGTMVDRQTILPSYDEPRGEPRGRLVKGAPAGTLGDCIDCNQCVAVCPTGIDIREGQQEGCITCGLCIDACDAVMDKVHRPRGLIRYAALDELQGRPLAPWWRRPRVAAYGVIMALAVAGIGFGIVTRGTLELNVIHERQPLFVLQSDGSIQNRYALKVVNKSDRLRTLRVSARGPHGLQLIGADAPIAVGAGTVSAASVFLRLAPEHLSGTTAPVTFTVTDTADKSATQSAASVFIGPQRP